MNRIFLALVILIVAAPFSLGQTKGNKTSDGNIRNTIEAANKKFVETFRRGDAARIADMYAEGARVMPPNSPMVQGRQRIQELWQSLIDTGAKFKLNTSDAEAQGNAIYEVGTYELIFPNNKRDAGKYVVVWRRQKGDWKLAVDIWNSNMPLLGQ